MRRLALYVIENATHVNENYLIARRVRGALTRAKWSVLPCAFVSGDRRVPTVGLNFEVDNDES